MSKLYQAKLEKDISAGVMADDEKQAKEKIRQLLEGSEFEGSEFLSIEEVEVPEPEGKPDNSSVKEDGGISFPAWGIHVANVSEDEAKAFIKEHHEIDVDVDIPPAPQE